MTFLAAHTGPIIGDEYLPIRPDELFWGRLPNGSDRAALSVRSGSTVTVDTVSHEGLLEDQGRDPVRFFGQYGVDPDLVLREGIELAASDHPHAMGTDGPHIVTGPIEVVGAQPGDLLAITVVEAIRRVDYGIISARHGRGALPDFVRAGEGPVSTFASALDDETGAFGMLRSPEGVPCVRFPLAPFPGILGVASATPERLHSVPPGPHGGNIDINLLTVGSTLYLPVQVPGALAYVGDPHFSQGDGEVSLTAFEASLRVTLRFEVIPAETAFQKFGEVTGPLAETRDYLVPTGLDEDLDIAVQNCVRAALGLLQARYGLSREIAYAYLSAATDFNISQVVDIVKGAHARIRKSDFEW